jgi:hypothetical protein
VDHNASTRSQPAFRPRRQPELCQQGAGVDGNRTIRSIQCDDNELPRLHNKPGAESGAIDPDLACLIDSWSALDDAAQVAIMRIVGP